MSTVDYKQPFEYLDIRRFGNLFDAMFPETPALFEEIKEKKFEFEEGDFKTTVTVRLNSRGLPISTVSISEYMLTPEQKELERVRGLKNKAVKEQNFELACSLRDEEKKLQAKINK